MVNESKYDKLIQHSIKEELRFLNAQLPGKQKSLQQLLSEETPSLICTDGSLQLIKRKELEYLSSILPTENWQNLFLPVIIEINPGEDEISIVCRGDIESFVVSKILGMPVMMRDDRIIIYKNQLAAIRKVLKTTTQYMFSPKILR